MPLNSKLYFIFVACFSYRQTILHEAFLAENDDRFLLLLAKFSYGTVIFCVSVPKQNGGEIILQRFPWLLEKIYIINKYPLSMASFVRALNLKRRTLMTIRSMHKIFNQLRRLKCTYVYFAILIFLICRSCLGQS